MFSNVNNNAIIYNNITHTLPNKNDINTKINNILCDRWLYNT